MDEEYTVTVGRVIREWGLKGEVVVFSLTYAPERLLSLKEVALQIDDKVECKKIKSVRPYKGNFLLAFHGCETPEEASKYRGALIKIRMSESPKLPEGVYYYYQIVGLDVYTVEGDYIGKVVDIIETGSNDVYVVKDGEIEHLIPAVKDVVKKIDLDTKRVIVKLMEEVEV